MVKLKSLIKEYISNPILDLKYYLNMPARQQKEDLADRYHYFVGDWIKNSRSYDTKLNDLLKNNETYDVVDILKAQYPEDYTDFLDWMYSQVIDGKLDEHPSWYVLRYMDIIKNQWLLHFSDNAKNIWQDQKFKYGFDDLDRLAYTTHHKKSLKRTNGYNFAYDLKDYAKYGRSRFSDKKWKYGKEAVLFRASGIKAYHYGDEEPQVIFWGPTANNIVYIIYSDGDWVIEGTNNRVLYKSRFLTDVVKWAVNNFEQYKNVLLP
jgi:hypothetical protein